MATIGKYGKIEFSEKEIQFIIENFQKMTNQQIADALELKKTVVRTKAYELGLKRMNMEYWPKEAVEFLKLNYHIIGNVEMVKIFTKKFPKQKGWTTSHIDKKIDQLKLKRTKEDWLNILQRNRLKGSFGTPKIKKNEGPLIKVIEVKNKKYKFDPGQTKQELFELIITNKIQPIEEINIIKNTQAWKVLSEFQKSIYIRNLKEIEKHFKIANEIGKKEYVKQYNPPLVYKKIIIELLEKTLNTNSCLIEQ